MKNHRSTQQQRAERHWQAGVAQARSLQWLPALHEFEQATRLAPQQAVYWMNLARAQMGLARLTDAVESARKAIALEPQSPVACRLCAESLVQLHRYDEAAECFARLSATSARDHDWYAAQGNAYFLAGEPRKAIDAFFQALSLKLDSPLVHYRMGLCFMDMLMKEEASECFRTAIALDDGDIRIMALALLVHESRQACRWEQLHQDTQALRDAIAQANIVDGQLLSPFAFIAIDCTPAEQRHIGELRSRAVSKRVVPLPPRAFKRGQRLRIGYLTADVHQHATAVLMAELLERRDTQRFEVFMYSHSRDDGSAIRKRVIAASDHFVDVTHLTHRQIAERIRADGVDILIDLKGHTRDSRYEVLAWRPAPVQATYLGYPGTTGADFIDYIIGDPIVTPIERAGDFSEHIAQLPWSYQPNDRQRALPPRPTRASVGLPEDALVLCSFNQIYKMSPPMFDLWARIMQRVPNAVLWMLAWNEAGQRNLLDQLAAHGVPLERVVFTQKIGLADHIARLRCADLFLDTWPCNAHTTASEALWAGVPVVTVPGPTFASRVAASLLRACRLDELACRDGDHYVDTVVALAHDLPRLRGLQRRLDEQRLQQPLFDTDQYARDFEALLERMAERAEQGLAPTALVALKSSVALEGAT